MFSQTVQVQHSRKLTPVLLSHVNITITNTAAKRWQVEFCAIASGILQQGGRRAHRCYAPLNYDGAGIIKSLRITRGTVCYSFGSVLRTAQ